MKYLVFTLSLFYILSLKSQNCLQNFDLSNSTATSQGFAPFNFTFPYSLGVDPWQGSHGSPQRGSNGQGIYCTAFPPPAEFTFPPDCLTNDGSYGSANNWGSEGVFYSGYTFKAGVSYNLSFKITSLNVEEVYFMLGNDIFIKNTNTNPSYDSTDPNDPPDETYYDNDYFDRLDEMFPVFRRSNYTANDEVHQVCFVPDKDYNQFWISLTDSSPEPAPPGVQCLQIPAILVSDLSMEIVSLESINNPSISQAIGAITGLASDCLYQPNPFTIYEEDSFCDDFKSQNNSISWYDFIVRMPNTFIACPYPNYPTGWEVDPYFHEWFPPLLPGHVQPRYNVPYNAHSIDYRIYDGYGNLLKEEVLYNLRDDGCDYPYDSQSVPKINWDGYFNGQPVAQGVYVVQITFENCTDKETYARTLLKLDGGPCSNIKGENVLKSNSADPFNIETKVYSNTFNDVLSLSFDEKYTHFDAEKGICTSIKGDNVLKVNNGGSFIDELEPSTRIYPNPFNDVLYLSFDEEYENFNAKKVRITNQSGQEIYRSDSYMSGESIDASSFVPGMYFVESISSDGQRTIRKIVKN